MTMNRRDLLAFLSAFCAVEFVGCKREGHPNNQPPVPTPTPTRITRIARGAGASSADLLYQLWKEQFHEANRSMSISYDPVGSDEGIKRLRSGKVDFAGSDWPIAPGLEVVFIPTVIGGVVPIYNVQGITKTLKFTPEALAGIFSGRIKKWNHELIAESNNRINLPSANIEVFHRLEGSGTTLVFTKFLIKAGTDWPFGSNFTVPWPVGSGAPGSAGVANKVREVPNSIGYVEYAFAAQDSLDWGAVENSEGQFVRAKVESISAAVEGLITDESRRVPNDPEKIAVSLLNTKGAEAYPISFFTWFLIPVHPHSESQDVLCTFLRWMLDSGQIGAPSLGYVPLPQPFVDHALDLVSQSCN